jgi:hypothetical protein
MTIGPSVFNFYQGLNVAPPPPSGPPPPPSSPPSTPSTPAPAPAEVVIVTGIRGSRGSIGYLPFRGGGGRPVTPPPPPLPPPEEGTEVVVVTAVRQGRFATKEEAIGAAISAFQAHPNRANRELGVFVLQVGDRFDLGEIMVGADDQSLGSFSETGENGTIRVPTNATGLIHSHPPSTDTNRNYWPSLNDMAAWRLFEQVTGRDDFTMWVVGPDGATREFGQETDVPANLDRPRFLLYPDAVPTPPISTVPRLPVPNPYVRPRGTPEP